ncbi:MAG: preprotein translocase subunit YajC [Planctomycetota bacterium]
MTPTMLVASSALTFPALAQIGHPEGAAPAGGASEIAPAGNGAAPGPVQQPASPFGGMFGVLLIGLFVFMIVNMFLSSRKQKRERQALLGALQKHDRVQMAGGVIGSIVEIKDAEVVLKVDPTTNTRITFSKSAVQQVLQSSGVEAAAESA